MRARHRAAVDERGDLARGLETLEGVLAFGEFHLDFVAAQVALIAVELRGGGVGGGARLVGIVERAGASDRRLRPGFAGFVLLLYHKRRRDLPVRDQITLGLVERQR